MRGSAVFRTGVAPGAALAPRWTQNVLWRSAKAVPSLDLRFAESKSLTDAASGQSLVTFTRASSGTYVGSDGVLKTATTNLLLRSEDLTTTWTKINCSISANAATAPNGTLTAAKVIEDTAASVAHIATNESATAVSGVSYCLSVYCKAAERSWVLVLGSGAPFGTNGVYVNLLTGALGISLGSPVGVVVTPFDNGWYRISFSITAGSSAAAGLQVRPAISNGNASYTGNGTSGIFVWGAQLEQSSTVGEYIPTTSTINSAPRFDHNPTTGESLGLLVEEARTNLTLNSEDLSPYLIAGTVSTNSATSPAGTSTADKLIATNGGPNGQVAQGLTITSGATVTGSVFVKAGGFDRLELVLLSNNNTTPYGRATINPNTGAITSAASTANGGTNASASVIDYGSGWYRFSVTVTYPAVTAAGWRLNLFNSDASNGDGVKGVFLWGMQFEQGAFPTSYIPTTTATATRSADVASITGANFSSWYNSSASTLYSEAQSASGSAYTGYVYTLGADFNNAITHYRQSDFQPVARIRNAGVDEYGANGSGAIWTGTSVNKFALAMSPTSGRQASNGSLNSSGDDSSITAPSASSMTLGALVGTSILLNGTIRRLVYWGQRLPNNVLQTITQ